MKINKIEINGYGKLSHQTFTFNEFQAILGKNEAGKTTIINFIKDMLFGFKNRKTSHPYAPKDKSEMGGRLYFTADGTDYVIDRSEGKKGGNLKLSDANGLELPNTVLNKILGPINRDTFDNLFYFGAPNLTEVSKLSKDELETRIRQVGVVGIQQWLELKKSIEKNAEDLYKPRGKKPELNQALEEYDELKLKIAEAQKSYDEFMKLNEEYKELAKQNKGLETKKQTVFNQLRAIQEDEQYWNNYKALENNRKHQIKLLPGFSNQDKEIFNDLANKLDLYRSQVTKISNELKKLTNDDVASANYKLYLANKNHYDDLYLQLDNQINNANDLQRLQRDIRSAEQQVENDNLTAGGNDSLLFNEADKNLVSDLNEQKRSLKYAKQTLNTSSKDKNKANNNWIVTVVIGVLIGLSGFVIGGIGLVLMALIGLALVGWGLYIKNNSIKETPLKSDDFAKQIEEVENQLQSIAKKYQINDTNSATWTTILQAAIIKRDSDRNQVTQLKQEMKSVSQQLNDYISSWNLPQLDGVQISQALIQIKQFMRENERNQQIVANRQQQATDKQTELLAQQKLVDNIQREQADFLNERELDSLAEFDKQYREQQEAQKQAEAIKNLQASLSEEKINQLKQYQNESDLKQRIIDLKQLDATSAADLTKISQQMSGIKAEINQLAKDGTYDELRQKLAIKKTEINDLVSKWLVLKLTDDWIEKVLNLASHGRFPQVQKLAQQYFNTLTDGHYVKVSYGKKLKVKSDDGINFEIKELSRGTMQQLYLSLIFALTMSFSDEFPMPIIIDDGFVDFDHTRTNAAISLMKEISKTTQVIYFTADDRIENQVNDDNLIKLG